MTFYPPSKIEVFRPAIGEEEIEAAAAVMRSGWIGRGPKVEEFESAWAAHIGAPRECVLSVSCATEGLYQIMQDIAKWHSVKRVVIPDNAFIGTAAAVLDSGLDLVLCDIDDRTCNPKPVHLNPKMRPDSALVYQHYGGFHPLDYAYAITQLGDLWDAVLIEDLACHPMGKPVGDYAVWSFDAMKILTCGDGGMLYCRHPQAAEAIRKATRLGMNTESGYASGAERWWEFTATQPGRRAMMNDLQAAIGLVQLGKLPQLVAERAALWGSYQQGLLGITWLNGPPEPPAGARSSYYTYWIQVMKPEWRDRLAVYLRERGIYTTFRYWPVHRAYGLNVLDCPNSDWAADHTLNLPLHPGLTGNDVEFICASIREFGRTL